MKCPKCGGRFSLVRDVCPNLDCNSAKLKLVNRRSVDQSAEVGRPTTKSATSSGHTAALFDRLHDSHRILDISFGVAATSNDRNDVIELQSFSRATPDALAFIPSPDEQPHVLGNWLANRSLETFAILQSFHFTSHLFDAPLTT